MMMWLSAALLLAGALMSLIAALGVLRLPDFFMRMHAATKAGVCGPALILAGVGCQAADAGTWIKILLALFFLLVTTPVAAHLLGKAGFVGGARLWQGTHRNALESVIVPGRFTEDAARAPAHHEEAADAPRPDSRT